LANSLGAYFLGVFDGREESLLVAARPDEDLAGECFTTLE